MMKIPIKALMGFVAVLLSGCISNIQTSNLPVGHWRNDLQQLDYYFFDNGYLSVVDTDGAQECSFEISTREKRLLSLWFKCPQPDQPGYAEYHDFEFADNSASFIDTLYIQGEALRIDGEFTFIGKAIGKVRPID